MSSTVNDKTRSPRFVVATLVGIVLIGAAPMIPVGIASLIAKWNGCTLSEGAPSTCLVWGFDWGSFINEMGVLGWFGLVSLPLAIALFVVWIIWFIISALLWHRKFIALSSQSERQYKK